MARPAYKTASESFPKSGNRELPIRLDFTLTGTIFDDLTPEMQASQIETIQSVYIDNSANTATLTLTILGPIPQVIQAQPFTQGYYPVISSGTLRYRAVANAGQTINIIFSNTEKKYTVWGPVPGILVVPALTPAVIELAPAAIGDNIVIAGVPLQTIKVYRVLIEAGAGTNVKFWSGAAALVHPLTGTFVLFAGGSITMQPSGSPWLTTLPGEGLNIASSAGVNIGGIISYVQS